MRRAYSRYMAKANCPKCGGTGYELVRREAAAQGAAASSPVAVLCDCVQAERGERTLERARIPSRYQHCDFESFETDLNWESANSSAFNASLAQAKLIVEGFVRDYPHTNEAGLLLMGPCGVGKTHLATAAVKALVARGHEALFYDYRELLKEIQGSYNPESQTSELSVLEPVLTTDVLLLDDLGSNKPSPWAMETVGHILNARYNEKRVTLLTTNYFDTAGSASSVTPMPSARRSQLPSGQAVSAAREDSLTDRLGMRVRSRLYEMCRTVELFAPDYRREVRQAGRVR